MTKMPSPSLDDIDPRLVSEAFRRARETTANAAIASDQILSAILAEARRGTRDIFGLVRAVQTGSLRGRECTTGLTDCQ
jgi:hypothetical protein